MKRLSVVVALTALLFEAAPLVEAETIPIGSRIRLTGPAVPRKHRVGTLVGRQRAGILVRVSGSDVVAFPLSGIETVQVAHGKKTNWLRVGLIAAAGAGVAASLHGPDIYSDSEFFRPPTNPYCGDYDLTCLYDLSRGRAIVAGVFGMGAFAARNTERWGPASVSDLAPVRNAEAPAPTVGPPAPAAPLTEPALGPEDDRRAGAFLRLKLTDGSTVKGTLTSVSSSQWTIHNQDGTMRRIERARVSKVEEKNGTRRRWREGMIFGAVLGGVISLVDRADCAGCEKIDPASRIAGGVVAWGLIGHFKRADVWTPFSSEAGVAARGPSLAIGPSFGRGRGLGVRLSLAW